MIAVMAALRDKPGWHRKVFNENKVGHWRAQALEFGRDFRIASQEKGSEERRDGSSSTLDGGRPQELVSEAMFDHVSAYHVLSRLNHAHSAVYS